MSITLPKGESARTLGKQIASFRDLGCGKLPGSLACPNRRGGELLREKNELIAIFVTMAQRTKQNSVS